MIAWMEARRWLLPIGLASGACGFGGAQAPTVGPATKAARDEAVEAATALVGRATILRGFYGGGELRYDAAGKVQGQPKGVDWTLAGMDVQEVSRGSGGEIEMEGVRVAIRYNPDQHTFERHPLKETKVRIEFPAPDAKQSRETLAAIFSVGIDPALQRSMPPAWKHYFIPATDWGADDLAGKTIVPANVKATPGLEFPVLVKKGEPEFTGEAVKDRVKGTVQLRLVVGVDGVPRRIAIRQPLGYGLDERTVEAAAKYRFQAGTQDGKPVPMEVIVTQSFEVPPSR